MEHIVEIITALTAFVVAAGAILKNSLDIRNLKKWACYHQDCPDRMINEPLQSKSSKSE